MANTLLGDDIKPDKFAVAGTDYTADTDPVEDLSTFLNTLIEAKKDFYFVTTVLDDEESQEEISTWASAYKKEFFGRTSVKPSSSVVSSWGNNTAIYYTTQSEEFPEMSALAYGSPKDAGSLTWTNMKVKNITPEDLSVSELTELEDAGYNVILKKYGLIVTNTGVLQGGLYIDQQRSQDYIDVRLEEDTFKYLANKDKAPFTDRGISAIKSIFEQRLLQAFNQKIIAGDSSGEPIFGVDVPAVADMPDQDVQDRAIRTLSFYYVEAGAIHDGEMDGEIISRADAVLRENVEISL
ncbi:MAG: DUF3383 domain-containing protein [Clostridiales bacterium]|nr:DUF3383 domain-containing protein [Clostridiales bacterium]